MGFDKIRIANAIEDTLDDEDDKLPTRYISNLSEIIRYIQVKYITGVNIINTTLGPIRKLKTPDSDEQCMNAIELVLPLLELSLYQIKFFYLCYFNDPNSSNYFLNISSSLFNSG